MYSIYTHAYTNIRIYIYRHTLVITIVRKQIKNILLKTQKNYVNLLCSICRALYNNNKYH